MNTLNETPKDRLARLLLAARAARSLSLPTQSTPTEHITLSLTDTTKAINTLINNTTDKALDKYGHEITYNTEQAQFIELATTGKSCILIGAAGTGKSTCQRGAVTSIIQSGKAGVLQSDGHKYLKDGTPGIVIVSFTRRAVSNIRKIVSEDMKANCLTIHSLLEYEPVYYEAYDEESGKDIKTMRFEPTRNMIRPLPSSIQTCIIEEGSMVSVELFAELKAALPSNCQYIFLGDIQQLPPVFGAAILGYKMLELPTIELTIVYRQALESPIIRLAHRILSGTGIPHTEFLEWKTSDKMTLHPWKKKLSADDATNVLSKFLTTAIDTGIYDPEEDMVLIPFNKSCGTTEINKRIANHLAKKRGAVVHEIIAGFNKYYLSIGDKVLYDKEDATIVDIKYNSSYTGASPQVASVTLDYWGFNSGTGTQSSDSNDTDSDDDEDDIDFILAQSASIGSGDDEERVRQASHIVTVQLADTGVRVELNKASDLNGLLLAYCLTVHKAQGSEFRKVFLLLHDSHNTMIQRELLYTAVTRAKEELYVICEPDHFMKGILKQRIKGNTLAEKAEYFKGKPLSITNQERML